MQTARELAQYIIDTVSDPLTQDHPKLSKKCFFCGASHRMYPQGMAVIHKAECLWIELQAISSEYYEKLLELSEHERKELTEGEWK